MAETVCPSKSRNTLITDTSYNERPERDAHVYLAFANGAYSFVLCERVPADKASEKEIYRATPRILQDKHNFAGALVAATDAMRELKARGGKYRHIYIHTVEQSVCLRAVLVEEWRKTGIYRKRNGGSLPCEAEWRAFVEATEWMAARFSFEHAKTFQTDWEKVRVIVDALKNTKQAA